MQNRSNQKANSGINNLGDLGGPSHSENKTPRRVAEGAAKDVIKNKRLRLAQVEEHNELVVCTTTLLAFYASVEFTATAAKLDAKVK